MADGTASCAETTLLPAVPVGREDGVSLLWILPRLALWRVADVEEV
jgi:hypothetical protein